MLIQDFKVLGQRLNIDEYLYKLCGGDRWKKRLFFSNPYDPP